MVPEAGLEPARPHQTLDFEFLLNPASYCNFDEIHGLELPIFPIAA